MIIKCRYFVLELCSASLDQCFLKDNDPKKYKGSLPSEAQVLYQLANGLNYIHSKKLIHREIKPENVLISAEEPVLVKWSDFGLSKTASAYSRNGPSMTSAGIKGTQYWMAPEVLSLENNQSASGSDADVASGTEASDVFSTGCVFFSYLMNGLHLFGSKNLIVANIMRGKPTNLNSILIKSKNIVFIRNITNTIINEISNYFLELATDHFAFELIASMTKLDAVKRSSLMETMDKLKPHL